MDEQTKKLLVGEHNSLSTHLYDALAALAELRARKAIVDQQLSNADDLVTTINARINEIDDQIEEENG